MNSARKDLAIFEKFNFEVPPIGVKFLFYKPEGLKKLDKFISFCEMYKEAAAGKAFYATKDNFECVGHLTLGMVEYDPVVESGQLGPRFDLYKGPSPNRKLYDLIPRLSKDSVNYVAFAPLDKLSFDPDVLVITANTKQAEIILRATCHFSGRGWNCKGTNALGCSWLFVYPYVTGELNWTVAGLGCGMIARQVAQEGRILISIPYNQLPEIVAALQDMKWDIPWYTGGAAAAKELTFNTYVKCKQQAEEEAKQREEEALKQ
jgi:uncharacterized protein (DUF169 family)